MKFLSDQDVYSITVRFLVGLGHNVVTASHMGLAQAEDADLLRIAHQDGRIHITRDRDFGGLVFLRGGGGGVIYLRMLPSTLNAVHSELERVLSIYAEQELQGFFVVIEPGRHRVRKLITGP